MRILQLSPQVPLPPDSEVRLGIYGITKHLAERGNEIYFAAYRKNADKIASERELSKFGKPIILDVNTNNNFGGAILNFFSGVPYNISKFKKKELVKFLRSFLKGNKIDIVHIDHLHLAWALDVIRNEVDIPVVLREHNIELKIMQRFYEQQKNIILKKYSGLQYNKFLKYEPSIRRKFDKCIMVSRHDEEILKGLNPDVKTAVIGVGVDKELLAMRKSQTIPYSIFHLGSLEWLPNYDGLNWYLEEIFPSIVKFKKEVKLYLYGTGTDKVKVPSSFRENIIKIGYVKDLWKEVLDKQLAVVPLRIGSGIRVKIIEMLATGQNIISTSVGKEGIDVEDGKHMLIADSTEEFISKTISYFENKYDPEMMSANAKKRIEEKYTWEKIAEQFENEYYSLIKK